MIGETVLRDRQLNVRLTGAQADTLERLAAEEGMSLSSFVRRTLIRYLSLPHDRSISPIDGENVKLNAEIKETIT